MRKFLAFVLALFLAIPMLIGSMVLISVRSWAVNRDFYKKALTDEALYAGIQDVPEIEASKTVVIGGTTFNAAALQSGVSAALPKEELKRLGGGTVDAVFDALEGKSSHAPAVDLHPLKASLEANAAKFASAYAESLPAGESATIDPEDLSALPKGMTKAAYASALKPLVVASLSEAFSKVDGRIDLSSVKATRAAMPFKRGLSAAYAVAMIGNLACALAIWLLAGLLWPKPWSGRLPFMGGVLVASSLAIILIGIGGALAVNAQSVFSALRLFGFPSDLAGAGIQASGLKAYFAGLAAQMTRGFFIVGIVAASIGAAFISMRWVAAAKEI